MSKVTIKDVAKLAGVSPSSVSNVINGINKCSIETRNKILEAMTELNYRPNLTAKALVTKRSNLIGVLYKGNTLEREVLRGIEASIRNYEEFDFIQMSFSNIPLVEEWILKRNLDGLIVIGDFSNNILSKLESFNRPIVCIDNYNDNLRDIFYINSEDTYGGYIATEALIKAGVEKPYLLCSRLSENEVSKRRYLGYLSCLEDYGILFEEEMLLEVEESSFTQGRFMANTIQDLKVKGIVCLHDYLAFGLIKNLVKQGSQVGKEIKLIGFENYEAGEYLNPSLTTIDTGNYDKGFKGIEILIKKIEKININFEQLSVDIRLIVRETI